MTSERVLHSLHAEEGIEKTEHGATPSVAAGAGDTDVQSDEDEMLYLLGRSSLKQYLGFVRHNAVTPPEESSLVEEWQATKGRLATLEKEEAGAADNPSITPISPDSKYEPLLTELLKDPLVHRFDTVPTDVAFVELDRLVVYQKHIDLTYVERRKRQLGPDPSDEELFRSCLPYDHPHPPVKWSRMDEDSYVFMSPSNDLRFLGTMPLRAEDVPGQPHPGDVVTVIGLAVGFGSNFLNVIHAGNRLILNNGSHRAYALRAMGFTHVPCLVQHASTREELELVAPSAVRHDPEFFLERPRPPMLRDYFDAGLHKILRVHREVRQVRVRFSVSESYVPSI